MSKGRRWVDCADCSKVRPLAAAREVRIETLLKELIAGEQSGKPQPFDNQAFLAKMRAKLG